MKKTTNLQPWIEYFGVLKTYERSGYLEMKPEKHEAFITRAAIHALSEGSDPRKQLIKAIPDTAIRLRAYAGWKSGWKNMEGIEYLEKPFAMQIVTDDKPYHVLYTLLLTRFTPWYAPWMRKDKIDVIDYSDTAK